MKQTRANFEMSSCCVSQLTMWFYVVSTVIFLIFLFLKHVYSYWDRQDGINSVTPNIPFGNIKSVIKVRMIKGKYL